VKRKQYQENTKNSGFSVGKLSRIIQVSGEGGAPSEDGNKMGNLVVSKKNKKEKFIRARGNKPRSRRDAREKVQT